MKSGVLGLPGPSRFSPDFQAASLVNSVLGQFGMMGRIGRSVREELGLAYYAYSQIDGGFSQGCGSTVTFEIHTGQAPAVVATSPKGGVSGGGVAERPKAGNALFGDSANARLQQVKSAYDPGDVIRSNHPVRPAG